MYLGPKKNQKKWKTYHEISQILVSGALDGTKKIHKTAEDIFAKSGFEKPWKTRKIKNSPDFSLIFPWPLASGLASAGRAKRKQFEFSTLQIPSQLEHKEFLGIRLAWHKSFLRPYYLFHPSYPYHSICFVAYGEVRHLQSGRQKWGSAKGEWKNGFWRNPK